MNREITQVVQELDYEKSVFVPEILCARNSVNIMQIRDRNEEGMGQGQEKKLSFSFSSAPLADSSKAL